jgi:membrane-bound serine protease (ClpP class)
MLKKIISVLILFFVFISSSAFAQEKRPVFNVINVDGIITSPTAKYITQGVEEAAREGAEGLIILLDTPGGMDTAMRDIAKSILNAPLPVIVFVYPPGARAASAGVIITEAAHIAAMAPGTNIGAAHPVAIGPGGSGMDKTMSRKVENDAAAYARSIAKSRGRSEEWAEKAVRKSESITAEEALKLNVIDIVAPDIGKLLAAIDQKELRLAGGGKKKISTANAEIKNRKMGTRQGILAAISDPNISYILLLIGLAGLYFELSTPGAILPGVVGGISLLLAFFGLSTLPVNYTGILLIVFGVILFIAEIKVMSHGMLTVGGIISLIMGSLLLFDTAEPALRVSLQVLIPAVLVVSCFFIAVIWMATKAQLRKHLTGAEAMIGSETEALTDIFNDGKVFLQGQYWRAISEKTIKKGTKVRIVKVEGLSLTVEEIDK